MSDQRRGLGRYGERLARRHLEANGYSILGSNYRTKSGEIDLVAERDRTLVFIEVRTRRGAEFGSPAESVTAEKRSHMVAAAEEYLQATDALDTEWRIDLVSIEIGEGGGVKRLDILENAVEL